MSQERRQGINGHKLIDLIRQHIPTDFEPADFLLAGSARLWAGNVLPRLSDLDILARPESRTWRRLQELAEMHGPLFGHRSLRTSAITGTTIAVLYGGVIEACDTWVLTNRTTDELIESAEVIGGIRYLAIKDVVAYKRQLDRPKDRSDLAKLRTHRPELVPASPVRHRSPAPALSGAVV